MTRHESGSCDVAVIGEAILLGMSSDHLVVDMGDHDVDVGNEMCFGVDYSALLRAATSPFVEFLAQDTGSRGVGGGGL